MGRLERCRAFVAVVPHADQRRALAGVTRDVAHVLEARGADATAFRWARPEGAHVTLAFLGPVARDRLAAVAGAVAAAVQDVAPFDLGFDGLGTFPPRGAPRVLWLAPAAGAVELTVLAGRVRSALAATTPFDDAPPFKAHLTLARLRRPGPGAVAPPWREALASTIIRIEPREVRAVEVLVSETGPTGAVYTTVARLRLGRVIRHP